MEFRGNRVDADWGIRPYLLLSERTGRRNGVSDRASKELDTRCHANALFEGYNP